MATLSQQQEDNIQNPYQSYYRSLSISVSQKTSKKDAEKISIQLGMIYNTLGGIIKDLVCLLSYKFPHIDISEEIAYVEIGKKLQQNDIFSKQHKMVKQQQIIKSKLVELEKQVVYRSSTGMDIEGINPLQLGQFQYKPPNNKQQNSGTQIIETQKSKIMPIVVDLSDDDDNHKMTASKPKTPRDRLQFKDKPTDRQK